MSNPLADKIDAMNVIVFTPMSDGVEPVLVWPALIADIIRCADAVMAECDNPNVSYQDLLIRVSMYDAARERLAVVAKRIPVEKSND